MPRIEDVKGLIAPSNSQYTHFFANASFKMFDKKEDTYDIVDPPGEQGGAVAEELQQAVQALKVLSTQQRHILNTSMSLVSRE